MSLHRWNSLLAQDWSEAWETLPDAPALIPRPKTAQITLRLPATLLSRLKRVAAERSLPYHALARSWLVDGLHGEALPTANDAPDEPQAEQLNLKLDQETLDELKGHGDQLRRPYHRLAREWIEVALGREEERLGLDSTPAARPAIKDLMVLLLHATDQRGQDAVRGVTHLQKLLFVIEQKLGSQRHGFYAFNYGPFDENVNDAADALRLAGYLRGAGPVARGLPSFEEMMATVVTRSGPREQGEVEEFALNARGHAMAERLRQSTRAYDQLFAYVRKVRKEWDTPDLVDRVYETWPEYTRRSVIRAQVAQRRARRGSH